MAARLNPAAQLCPDAHGGVTVRLADCEVQLEASQFPWLELLRLALAEEYDLARWSVHLRRTSDEVESAVTALSAVGVLVDEVNSELTFAYHYRSSYGRHVQPRASYARLVRHVLGAEGHREPAAEPLIPLGMRSVGAATRLGGLVRSRRTARQPRGTEMRHDQLASLLFVAYGAMEDRIHSADITLPARPVPSAGALYPLELYIVPRNVQSLSPGLYHYRPYEHGLARLLAGAAIVESLFDCCACGPQVACALIISACLARVQFKYGERGYRYALLEAGHVGQNICLSAVELDLDVVPLGGFRDEELSALLGLQMRHEAILYAFALGGS